MQVTIKKREEFSVQILDHLLDSREWKFGVRNKSHYVFDKDGKLIGCSNLILLFTFRKRFVYFLDSIEILNEFQKNGIGSQLLRHCLKELLTKQDNALIFLMVVRSNPERLRFFSKFQFQIIDKRVNIRGEHSIMTYPLVEDSREALEKIFDFFKWQSDNRAVISSDCSFAHNRDTVGLYWCEKKQIFVSGLEKQTCPYYIKGGSLVSKEKLL